MTSNIFIKKFLLFLFFFNHQITYFNKAFPCHTWLDFGRYELCCSWCSSTSKQILYGVQ